MPERTPIAVVGLGNMGAGMARCLLAAGFDLAVHNRTAAKAAPLAEAGAAVAASPAEAVRGRGTVLLSLADDAAVEEVLFGAVLPALAPGSTVIDTSTVSPGFARRADARVHAAGMRRVEATVVGNPRQAHRGELRVFTAGEAAAAAAAAPVLDALAAETRHVGEAGNAAAVKLVFNLVLAAQLAGFAEAVQYGAAAGLDRDLLVAAVAGSGFASPVLRFRADIMRKREYEPALFRTALMEKDLRLALGTDGPGGVLAAARERFAAVVAAGDGDKDAAVVVEHPPA